MPPHPGSRIEILEEFDLARAAEILGVRRAALFDLLNEKASLSPEMTFRIEKAFGASMDALLRMGACYEGQRQRNGNVERYEPGARGRERGQRSRIRDKSRKRSPSADSG